MRTVIIILSILLVLSLIGNVYLYRRMKKYGRVVQRCLDRHISKLKIYEEILRDAANETEN